MAQAQLVLPRYLIPVRPAGQVLENHAVLISNGRIAAIGDRAELLEKHGEADLIHLREHALLPGLVNMHTHSPMTLLRGYADDMDLHAWLHERIWPAENRFVGPAFVADGTRLAIFEMIRGGTTCFNDNYFFPDVMARVANEMHMRAFIGLPLLDQPSSWACSFDEYLEKGLEITKSFEDSPLVGFSLAPHAPYSVSDRAMKRLREVSSDLSYRVHLHCLETDYDVKHSVETYGIKPLERLSQHGLLNEQLIAVHMTQVEAGEIDRLAEAGVHVVHCPQSNLKLASGICPVQSLITSGVNVCIGTDGAASNNNLDLLEEVRTAALLAKGACGDPCAVNAVQAIDMLTINAARALGLESELGTLETGKWADMAALDLSQVQSQPVYNLFSQIVYAASARQFTDVWIGGDRILTDGAFARMDEIEVIASAKRWQEKIQPRLATPKVGPR